MVPIRRCRSLRPAQVLTACAIVVDPDPQACRNGMPRDWAYPKPHFRRDSALCHICTGTGFTPATSALGLGSALPTSVPGLQPVDPIHSLPIAGPRLVLTFNATLLGDADTLAVRVPGAHATAARCTRLCTSRATLRVLPRQGRPSRVAGFIQKFPHGGSIRKFRKFPTRPRGRWFPHGMLRFRAGWELALPHGPPNPYEPYPLSLGARGQPFSDLAAAGLLTVPWENPAALRCARSSLEHSRARRSGERDQ